MHLLYLAFTLTFLARLHITTASDDLDYTSSDTTAHIPIPDGFQFDLRMVSAKSGGKYRAPTAVLDVDAYPVAPPELELEQVHVYIRHGERTPVSVRMSEQPASIPEHWIMCNHSRNFRVAMKEFQGSSDAVNLDPASLLDAPTKVQSPHGNVKHVVERENGMAMEGECLLGQLSDLGKETTHNYGLALRRLYVDRLKFLPITLSRQSDAYFRSTNIPRTIESLQEIIHGLYPVANCSPGVAPVLRVRNGRDENLLGNTLACKRLSVLLVNFADAAAAAYNPVLEPLDEKISKYIGGNPVRINGQPRASGILDTVRSAMAHGVKLPPEFEDRNIVETIEKAVVNEWFAGCEKRPYHPPLHY
ncbi:hypothetical protein EVG20_g315 [Dentipellis fragilis]|uniref:Acid phosphatase n=1 Tax=Dentipellis fragilis TaxID=205917 RepID=A0A4Y9ZG11_9AGAM|nr:hypothetical protein EVG20_g315 [Dentipellis fragilis]